MAGRPGSAELPRRQAIRQKALPRQLLPIARYRSVKVPRIGGGIVACQELRGARCAQGRSVDLDSIRVASDATGISRPRLGACSLVNGPPGSVRRVNTHLALLVPVLTRITTHTPSSPSIFAWDRNVLDRHCRARRRSSRAVNTRCDRGCQQALSYAIQTTFAMLVRLNESASVF